MKQAVTIVLCQTLGRAWSPALWEIAARVNWPIKEEKCLQEIVKNHWLVDSHQAGHSCVQGRPMEPLSSREPRTGTVPILPLGNPVLPSKVLGMDSMEWGQLPTRGSTKTSELEPEKPGEARGGPRSELSMVYFIQPGGRAGRKVWVATTALCGQVRAGSISSQHPHGWGPTWGP